MAWPSKRRPYLRCNLESSKCVRRYLLCCCFFASKYVILHQRNLSCCSLSFKHIRQGLPVSLELPTRWLMPFFLPFSLEKVKANFCSCFKTCECMSQTLLSAFWAPEKSGLLTWFVAFQPPKRSDFVWFSVSNQSVPYSQLILTFESSKYMRSTFCVALQRLKRSLLPFFKQFNI